MALNKKLLELGNNVVALAQKIENLFPGTGPLRQNEVGSCLMDLLNLVNKIRLAAQEGEEDKTWRTINLQCSNLELLEIKQQMEAMQLNYEILSFIGRK